ncbi:RlpA-like double-psi beta-barrel-protein domain-containing protein-containing protein, partial [Trametes elegans]
GACGGFSKNSDRVVALNSAQYAGGSHCGHKIRINHLGKSIDATVVDECPSCGHGGIDLSPGAFGQLAALDVGVLPVTWRFV